MSIYDGGSGGHQQPHPAEALEISARHVDRMMGLDAGAARSDSRPSMVSSRIAFFLPDDFCFSLGERLSSGAGMGGGGVSGLQVLHLKSCTCT